MSNHTREPGLVPLLKLILSEMPSLPDAACSGRPGLFDPQGSIEDPEVAAVRHRQAQAVCQSCPALTPCRDWVDSQAPHRRPAGVVGGRLPAPHTRKGRPPRVTQPEETAS